VKKNPQRKPQGMKRRETLAGGAIPAEWLDERAQAIIRARFQEWPIKVHIVAQDFFEPEVQKVLRHWFKLGQQEATDDRLALPIRVFKACYGVASHNFFENQQDFHRLFKEHAKACCAILTAVVDCRAANAANMPQRRIVTMMEHWTTASGELVPIVDQADAYERTLPSEPELAIAANVSIKLSQEKARRKKLVEKWQAELSAYVRLPLQNNLPSV